MASNGPPPKRKSSIETSPPPPVPANRKDRVDSNGRQEDQHVSSLVAFAMLGMAIDSSDNRNLEGPE